MTRERVHDIHRRDSLTAGVGANGAQSYPSVLSQLTGHSVVNAGGNGNVSIIATTGDIAIDDNIASSLSSGGGFGQGNGQCGFAGCSRSYPCASKFVFHCFSFPYQQ